MGLQSVVAPATEPITLGEARQHCRIDQVLEDGLIAGYIIGARTYVATHLRRSLLTQTWDLTIDYEWPGYFDLACQRWTHRIVLPRPPVQSVTSISYIDSAGVTQVLAADQWKLAKIGTDEWVIEPTYGATWPSVRREIAAATVRFVAGYGSNPGDVPEDIRHAMRMLIAHWDRNREAVNVGNIVNEMPLAVEQLLFPYRVFY